MSVDLNKVTTIKNSKHEGKKKYKQAKTNADLMIELNNAWNDKSSAVGDLNIFTACSWIESNDLWIKDKKRQVRITNSYPRRKLVTVQLGAAHFGSEAAFSHPAVVLYEEKDWAMIAPITSKKYNKGLEILIDIPKGSCSGLTEDSTIQVDHIRAISKNRITGTLPGKLPNDFMDQINLVITKKYAPALYKDYFKLQDENEELRKRIKDLESKKNLL